MKPAYLVSRTYPVPVEDLLERFNTENKQQITKDQLVRQFGHKDLLPDLLPSGEVSIGTIQGHSKAFTEKYYTSPENLISIPRGRNGGRPQIADQPTQRRNISITNTDYDYAASIGNGASDGIRVALEYHRSHSRQRESLLDIT